MNIDDLTSLMNDEEKRAFIEGKKINEKSFNKMCLGLDKYKALEVSKHMVYISRAFLSS